MKQAFVSLSIEELQLMIDNWFYYCQIEGKNTHEDDRLVAKLIAELEVLEE